MVATSSPVLQVTGGPSVPKVLTRASSVHPGRLVEVGFVPHYVPQRFALVAEGLPVWLFTLERSFCSELIVLGFDSAKSYRVHLEANVCNPGLVYRAMSHLGLGRVTYTSDCHPPPDAVLLASGPVPFLLDLVSRSASHPTLLLCADHW